MKLYKLLVFIIFYCPVTLWANPVLENFLNSLQTLHAQFEQRQFSETGKLLEISKGEVYVKRPGKFRWEYQQPYDQLIVADGRSVWIYDKDLEQVTIKNLDDALGKTPALLLSTDGNVNRDFFVIELPRQRQLTRLLLKPKNEEAQFKSIQLNLQGSILSGLELKDNFGQTTFIAFKQAKNNLVFNESLFVFRPPSGTDIIENR
jgi:outer membrane lipoprotein carrier protein